LVNVSFREVNSRVNNFGYLLSGVPDKDMAAMELGLAHSLSRYKLKFSPDKIDTMIVQVGERNCHMLKRIHTADEP
jgi:nucleolar protein 58